MKKLAVHLYDRLSGATTPYWPTSIELTADLKTHLDRIVNNEYLGPTPITQASLVSNICDYMAVLHQILRKYELYNAVSPCELAVNVSPWWAYQNLKEHDDFINLSKKQRQAVSRQLRKLVNDPGSTSHEFSTNISDDLLTFLVDLIDRTRKRLENSRRYQSGNLEINLDQCFVPSRSSLTSDHRLFQLLPHQSNTMPFVHIGISTLVPLVNSALDINSQQPKASVSNLKGIQRVRGNCATFYRFFKFKKVRMGNW